MKLIQFNINILKMTYLGPAEMFYLFLTLCFIAKLCVLACLIIWMHTNNLFLFLQ